METIFVFHHLQRLCCDFDYVDGVHRVVRWENEIAIDADPVEEAVGNQKPSGQHDGRGRDPWVTSIVGDYWNELEEAPATIDHSVDRLIDLVPLATVDQSADPLIDRVHDF